MRKFFTLLTLCLLASFAWGETVVTFIPGETVGNNETAAGADEMSLDGITVSTTAGGLKAQQYRFAKGSVTTISSTIGNITKIEFSCEAEGTNKYGPGCFEGTDGYTYEGKIGTWTGNAASVQFTAVSNQVRANKIVVTVGGDGLGAPTIKPAGGTYYNPIEVTITCSTSGADIYYTVNGNDPTTSSTKYTAPFTLSSNTTVKAISSKDGKTSDVVSAEYVFETATAVANIRAYQNVADGTVITFTNPVNVLAQSGSRMFVKDNTGYALFFGSTGQTYTNGDVIPAGFAGEKTTWDGEPELKNLASFQAASGNSPIDPTVINATQIDASHFANYVKLENVTFDKTNKLIKDASGEGKYYCNMNVKDADIDESVTYEYVLGIVGSYGKENTVYQFLPTYLKSGDTPPPPPDGISLCELADAADNSTVTIKNDAIVLGQSGSYLYLKDTDCGYGLMYGSCGQTYDFGDVVPAGYGGTKTVWDGEPELKNLTGFKEATTEVSSTLTPDEITPAQVSHETWGHYVLLKQVMIDTEAMTFSKNGESCPYYPDRFGVTVPNDGKAHDVYGIVASYGKAPNTVYQILPLSFDEKPKRKGKPEVASLEELYALNKGTVAHFTTPLIAIYQNKEKKDLYIIDADGEHGLVYGDVNGTFNNGDIINGAEGSWTTYNNNLQVSPVASTFVPDGHVTPIAPEEMPIEEISQDLIHHYFTFSDVAITSRVEMVNDKEQTNYYVNDGTGEMMLFDRYSVGLADLDQSATYDFEAFLTIFSANRIMELYPINMKKHGVPTPLELYDVNHDGEVNIADINALIDMILSSHGFHDCNGDGEMNVADVNALINYILNS